MNRTAFLGLCLLLASASQAQKEPIRLTDMLKIKSVGEIRLNKDGSQAAFTVTSIEPEYKYSTQIYLAPTDGSAAPRQLTAKDNATQPAWSPDGKQLAFVRTVDGKAQIFLLSLNGGEATQFTRFRYGASSPKWSPDGKELLFVSHIGLTDLLKDSILNPNHEGPHWPFEKPGSAFQTNSARPNPDGSPEEIRAWLESNVADKKAKVIDRLSFQDEMEVNPDFSFSQWFVQSTQPSSTPVPVTHGFYDYNSVDYTPDGKQLLISADIDSTEHPDRVLESEIFLADRDGRNLHLLLGEKGTTYNSPRLSPSGRWLAFQSGPVSFVSVPQLTIMELKTGVRSNIRIDRTTGNYVWSPDDRYLYFTALSNGGTPIYRVTLPTLKVEQLLNYDSGTGSFDLRGEHLVFSRTEVADPSELYASDISLQSPKPLTHLNTDWLAARSLSLPEKHEFKNSIGETVEYWVMKPNNYKAGQKYPLLLDIHGGPSAMWGPGESSMWHEFQYFCSRGYGVVYCNPRGSGGYGIDFLRANVKDWGAGPAGDVLTALDKAVAEGWADTSKLVVSGGSYAGYLTAWIVGHDHRFKAACAQRGVYDLATFFGEGNAWRLVPNYFGGYPWEPATKAILQRESPITYVENITTPLIIFHGENDRRTGFVQGEMLFRSLKALNRPVEYVRHPGATHEITRSGDNRQRMDQMLRTYEFFERYIKH